jgi:hypothetical protein
MTLLRSLGADHNYNDKKVVIGDGVVHFSLLL